MEDFMKMFLFIFLGLIIAIMVLGYHRSPQAGTALGRESLSRGAGTPKPPTSSKQYPSNQRNY